MNSIEIKTVKDFENRIPNKNKIFRVTFRKKDGSIRHMVARFGVKKYSKGIGMLYNAASRNNIVVFSMHDVAYRTFNIKRLLSFKIDGLEYTVNNN